MFILFKPVFEVRAFYSLPNSYVTHFYLASVARFREYYIMGEVFKKFLENKAIQKVFTDLNFFTQKSTRIYLL